MSLTIWSNAEAWDSARGLTEYLDGLKNVEADHFYPFSLYYFKPLIIFTDSVIFFVL
jgi:hypothetical protein